MRRPDGRWRRRAAGEWLRRGRRGRPADGAKRPGPARPRRRPTPWPALGHSEDPHWRDHPASLTLRGQGQPDRVAGQAQQRPQHEDSPSLRPDRRRRPFAGIGDGRTLGPHRCALGQIAGGVAQQQDLRPGLAGGSSQQGVTRAAGRGGQSRRRLVAGPGERCRRRAQRPRLGDGFGGPAGAVGLKPMIDHQRQHGPIAGPIQNRLQQEERVAAAGKSDGDRRGGAAIEPPVEGGSDRL